MLLYGVGKARDEARAAIKKLTKEICKLFGKKCSIDIAEGIVLVLFSLVFLSYFLVLFMNVNIL